MTRHVSIILLYDSQKRVLLQHRDENIEWLPGYWAFFGGGIEEGETPKESAIREAKEELDYDLKNPKLMFTQKFKGKGDTDDASIKYVFMEEYDPTKKITQHEGQGMKWVKIEDAQNLKMIHHDLTALEMLKGKY